MYIYIYNIYIYYIYKVNISNAETQWPVLEYRWLPPFPRCPLNR